MLSFSYTNLSLGFLGFFEAGSHYVAQVVLNLGDPSVSTSQVLRLQACAITPDSPLAFF
jgi:hypothetical protein